MVTVNAKGSATHARVVSLLAAAAMLGWAAGAGAQVAASDLAAGYVVLPKIVVHTTGGIPPVVAGAVATDTLVQLTNTNQNGLINVDCWWVNANSHCGGTSAGLICENNAQCPLGQTCVPMWATDDFQITVTAGQPIAFLASTGLSSLPCDPVFPGPGCPGGRCSTTTSQACSDDTGCPPGETCVLASGSVRQVPEDPFRGELKCVQVDGDDDPVARNDLKMEATIVTTQVPTVPPGPAGATTAAAYSGIGFLADTTVTPSQDPLEPLCLGSLPSGTPPGTDCNMEYAPCPETLILNHFFEGATPEFGGVVNTELTLVPCSEDLGNPADPGVEVLAQMLVYNEFEQRFSTSARVDCYRSSTLSDIDTMPGPGGDAFSIFAAGVQGTATGQTRIRGVQGAASRFGYGLLAVACEQYRAAPGGPVLATDAFNVHLTGFNAGGDAVYLEVLP